MFVTRGLKYNPWHDLVAITAFIGRIASPNNGRKAVMTVVASRALPLPHFLARIAA